MKKQIIGMMCLAAMMSSCHIYKSYDRPETIDASGIYRDPASATDTLAADTTNMGNLPWKDIFRDAKLQALIEEGLANNVDMQAAALRVQEAKVMLTSAKLSYLPSINLVPQGTATSMDGGTYNGWYIGTSDYHVHRIVRVRLRCSVLPIHRKYQTVPGYIVP